MKQFEIDTDIVLLDKGLFYDMLSNKIVFTNDYLLTHDIELKNTLGALGLYAAYYSEDPRDNHYAKMKGITLYQGDRLDFNHSIADVIDTAKEIKVLMVEFPEYADLIKEEYDYLKAEYHNELLLEIAFLVVKKINEDTNGICMMRGSGISSFILYLIGLNKVNPLKFGLDYRNFWKKGEEDDGVEDSY